MNEVAGTSDVMGSRPHRRYSGKEKTRLFSRIRAMRQAGGANRRNRRQCGGELVAWGPIRKRDAAAERWH
jgi:hypothetical protein